MLQVWVRLLSRVLHLAWGVDQGGRGLATRVVGVVANLQIVARALRLSIQLQSGCARLAILTQTDWACSTSIIAIAWCSEERHRGSLKSRLCSLN